MQRSTSKSRGQSPSASNNGYQFMNWYFVASISFILAIVIYQILVAVMSKALGYTVDFHFGKVDTLPHSHAYWSGGRVLVLFSIPSLFMMVLSAFFSIGLLGETPVVTIAIWLRFWFVFFGTLIGTTLLTLSLFPKFLSSSGGSYFHQGFSVIASWFDLSELWVLLLFSLSVIINLVMGFVMSSSFFYLSPSDNMIRHVQKKYPTRTIVKSFLYTVFLTFGVSVILSYPDYFKFFIVLFLHAFFWLPGLMFVSTDAIVQRSNRKKDMGSELNHFLLIVLVLLVISIRIFFK